MLSTHQQTDINFYKIGLSSIASGGLGLANDLKAQGKRVFIDLKLFDIGSTIEKAVHGLSQFDIDFLTVHGDPHVIKAAIKGKRNSKLKILAVTLLTSLNREDLDKSLIRSGTVENLVTRRAQVAFDSGADGIICSPNEVKRVRSLKNSIGKKISSEILSMNDNGLHQANYGACTFDGEGTPTQNISVIEAGILKNFIHSEATARYFKTRPTGHGSIGSKASVSPDWPVIFKSNGYSAKCPKLDYKVTTDEFVLVENLHALHAGIKASQGSFSLPFDGWLVTNKAVSYTHLRAHETLRYLV